VPERLTIEEMQKLAKSKNGKCLSKKYLDSKTKLKWQCKEGHVWKAIPSDIKRRHWCPICGDAQKSTIEKMRKIARDREGKCLSSKYINNHTKLEWKCKAGHVWEATPTDINGGHWCPKCGVSRRADALRSTIIEMQRMARTKGGECLSLKYINSNTKLRWQCSEGHIWEAAPRDVKTGHWCPKCAGVQKLTIEEMRNVAKTRGGKCLSKEYIGNDTKLKWCCKYGHEWEATSHKIKSGKWCPFCLGGIGRSEKICRKHFEIIFDEKFPKKKPRWLMFRGTRLELDGYCEKLKLAFEYQGAQHYKKIDFFIRKLKLQKEYDQIKTRLCRNNSVTLIKIPYTVKFEKMADYIIEKCRGRKIRVPKMTKSLNYKLFNVYSPEMLNEMQELAKSRGGKCLSTAYIDSKTKLEWQCEKGHIWMAAPDPIKRGSWCLKCSGSQKLTIEEMQKIARSRGGICLSDRYVNTQTKLEWKCKKSHIWMAAPSNIKTGHWCPKCAGMQKLTIKEMQNLAKANGGTCLSKRYVDTHTKLRWRCKKGHVWEAMPYSVKNGHWCWKCGVARRASVQRLTIKEMQKIAKSKGGKCLSKKYVNVETKLEWMCSTGHKWKATPHDIRDGTWCPKCARNRRKK